MPQVIVNEQLVSYRRHDKGEAVLLIHGWGDSATGMRVAFDDLSESATLS